MRRLVTVAPLVLMTVAWSASALYAQQGGGHGGSSGHSAPSSHSGFAGSHGGFGHGGNPSSGPGFHGGFSGPGIHDMSPGRVAGPQRSGFRTLPARNFVVPPGNTLNGQPHSSGRPFNTAPAQRPRFVGNRHEGAYDRSGFADGRRHREPYRRDRRHDRDDFFIGGAVLPWWLSSYGYLGYPNLDEFPAWWNYDDSSDAQASAPQGPEQPDSQQYYGPQQAPPEGQDDSASLPRWPSIPPPEETESAKQQSATVAVSAPTQPSTPVTLVFKDGRPPEKIHNFLVTAGTLYVMDQQRQDIPIAELDLTETARVNRQAGVEFSVPGAQK